VLAAHVANVPLLRTGAPIPAPPPPNAPHATKEYTPEFTNNWSGYAQEVSTATGPYTAVRDYWTVPRVDTSLSGKQYSSDWVGIDEGGQGKDHDSDLVQDGTEADNIDGTATYLAWTEILPAKEVEIPGLAINPGDLIEGVVEERSENVWKMTVYDLTTGQHGGRKVTYDASNGGPATQTAVEAIHERPCLADPCSEVSNLATLAQTTSVPFDPGSYSTATYTPQWKPLLTAAPGATVDRIFMMNGAGTTIASPSVPTANDEGFTVADGATAPPAPWGTTEKVPGLAALNTGGGAAITSNTGGGAAITSVSCASAGNCSAGGDYTDSSGHSQAFVVNEVNGAWDTAEEVPGTASLNTGGAADLGSVSCASAGNCTAGGDYTDSSGGEVFLASEVNGAWGTAEEIPGTASLNTYGAAGFGSVSCGSAGNCSAGGGYLDASGYQAFVVSEVNGAWDTAEEVPGTASLNSGGMAGINSVSCPSAGSCSADGYYTDATGREQAFVTGQVGGTWGTAAEVSFSGAIGGAEIESVSCPSAGNCSAGGTYSNSAGTKSQVFTDSEVGGTWGTAAQVPGIAKLNTGGYAYITSVSCASAGTCSAGGYYTDGSGDQQGFVVKETGGSWGASQEVPGLASLNTGNAVINSVSCASASACSAGGYYSGGGFVTGKPSI
jgi:hypothetical protein